MASAKDVGRLALRCNVGDAVSAGGIAYGRHASGGMGRCVRRPTLIRVALLIVVVATATAALTPGVGGQAPLTPPVPESRPHTVYWGKVPGEDRGPEADLMDPPRTAVDDLYWLRDDTQSEPTVLAHLAAENAYTNASTWAQRSLRKKVFNELRGRIRSDDASVPLKRGGFVYYSRVVESKEHKLHCRRSIVGLLPDGTAIGGAAAPADGRFQWDDAELGSEEVYLDENELAAGTDYFRSQAPVMSSDHAYAAYTVDFVGKEMYELRVRHVASGREWGGDTVKGIRPVVQWGLDNRTIFYVTITDVGNRSHKVVRRTLAPRDEATWVVPAAAVDEVLLDEGNVKYHATFVVSRTGRMLFMSSYSWDGETEYSMVDLRADAAARAAGRTPPPPVLVEPRRPGHHSTVAHLGGDTLLVVTNTGGAANNKLVTTTIDAPASANWVDVFPYNASVTVVDASVFSQFVLLHLRIGGYPRFATVAIVDGGPGGRRLDISTYTVLNWAETVSAVSGVYGEYDSRTMMTWYETPTLPSQLWAIDGLAGNRTLVRETVIPNYDPSLYRSERWEAKSDDGTMVPMSAVYRVDRQPPAGVPTAVHMEGYGGFNIAEEPWFNPYVVPLLDRGVVRVTAHVRGGGEFGPTWWEAGKLGTKNNSFTDFIACGRHLTNTGVTSAANMTISGGSAGGTLMGGVFNRAPDLAAAILLHVPLLDPLTTLADSTASLSATLWGEWGNPNTARGYEWIRGYSPMQNIGRGVRPPAMLITAGWTDNRVGYWEGAQFAARVRAAAPDAASAGRVLYTVDSEGHRAGQGRFGNLAKTAQRIAWLLWQHGIRA